MAVPVTAALAAAQAGQLGVGFSGAGFLIPFFLGVIDILYRDLRVLNHTAPVAGASAGALATSAAMGLIPVEALRAQADELSSFCRARGNCYGILKDAVVNATQRVLPADAAELTAAHGRIYIAVTHPSPDGKAPARQELVGKFSSRDDIVEAVATSSYIPLFSGPRVTTDFRGERCYDGSWAGPGQGFLPCPPGLEYCIRVSSLPPGIRLTSFFVEEIARGNKGFAQYLTNWVSAMLSTTDLGRRVKGMLDAYGAAGGAPVLQEEARQLSVTMRELSELVTPGEGGADIWPGRFHQMPFKPEEWTMMQAAPADAKTNAALFEFGRKEALSWARHVGFPAAAAAASVSSASESASASAPRAGDDGGSKSGGGDGGSDNKKSSGAGGNDGNDGNASGNTSARRLWRLVAGASAA